MCGICGSVDLSGAAVDPRPVREMLARLVHRGPDAEGLLVERGIAAGIRRLAVIDVEGGDQPIANEDDTVRVVFNGEIYNYRELGRQLVSRGHRLRTRADTEVLVHLWEELGPRMVDELNGMFAFCIHDRRRHETFLARDRLGIKPLFYARRGDGLVFASEIAALLRHEEVVSEVDPAALVELFCLQFVSGEGTVYRGVQKLLPGHAIHVREGRARVYRYYGIPAAEVEPGTEAERAEQLRELLDSSVRYRRISDVPLGLFLSGGIDSSVVAAVLCGLVDHPPQTFSVGFEGDAALDERRHAGDVATHLGTEHHELVVSPVDIARHLPALIRHLAEPVVDPALVPTYLLSRFAREKVTVVLTGEGADELFGGYKRYLYQQRFGWLARLPGVAGTGRDLFAPWLPRRWEQAIDAVVEEDPARSHLEWASVVGTRIAAALFEPDVLEAHARRLAEHFARYFEGGKRLADQLRADQQEWLPHNLLAKVDRASMAASLEARVPFLDHRIVEWAAGLPDALRIRGRTTKYLLREAYRDRLPRSILDLPKRGFDLPLAAWIRGPLRSQVGDLLGRDGLRRWPGLDAAAVASMLERHLGGAEDFGLPLFNLLSVILFLTGAAEDRG